MSGTTVIVKEKSTDSSLRNENRSGRNENRTGIPMELKERLEQSTGVSLGDVRVNYNSSRPSRLDALAYTMGNHVEIGPGQERHLPHELGHVIQQKLGIVRANAMHPSGMPLNTAVRLERQADEIGSGKRSTIIQRMSQNAAQRCENKNIIQLRLDDVKINANQCGTDPTADTNATYQGAGLTCHHVISADVLERFFEFCDRITSNGNKRWCQKIKTEYEKWKNAAIDSATATSNRRSGGAITTRNEISSACQWMAGNVFIGPLTNYRIDDKGRDFDRGGFRDIENHNSNERDLIEYDNNTMDELCKLYETLKKIENEYYTANDGNIVIKNDTLKKLNSEKSRVDEIINVLKQLSDFATYQTTLHEITASGTGINLKRIAKIPSNGNRRPNGNQNPTYNVNDWVSVGKIPINGMKDEKEEFKKMYEFYKFLEEKTEKTEPEKKFYMSFKDKINIDRYKVNYEQQITANVVTLLNAPNNLNGANTQAAITDLDKLKRTMSYKTFKELYDEHKKIYK